MHETVWVCQCDQIGKPLVCGGPNLSSTPHNVLTPQPRKTEIFARFFGVEELRN